MTTFSETISFYRDVSSSGMVRVGNNKNVGKNLPAVVSFLLPMSQCRSLKIEWSGIDGTNVKLLSSLTSLTWLDLSGNHVGDGVQALSALPSLTFLDVSNNEIDDKDVTSLSTVRWSSFAISSLTSLLSLNIGHNNIGVKGARALGTLTSLTSLNIEKNKIDKEGARALGTLTSLRSLNIDNNSIHLEALENLTSLTTLYVCYNNVNVEVTSRHRLTAGIAKLDHPPSGGSAPRTVDIAKLDHPPSGGTEASSLIYPFKFLRTLSLSFSKVGDKGLRDIGSLTSLTSLDIECVYSRDEEAPPLGIQNSRFLSSLSPLSSLTALTSLNLRDNNIGSSRANMSLSSLGLLTSLTSLNLELNKINTNDARTLAFLGSLISLKSLNLANNLIGSEGIRVLGTLTSLTSLNLTNNDIGNGGAQILKALTSLTSLNLQDNGIRTEGVRALGSLTSITYLNLDKNGFSEEGAQVLHKMVSDFNKRIVFPVKPLYDTLLEYFVAKRLQCDKNADIHRDLERLDSSDSCICMGCATIKVNLQPYLSCYRKIVLNRKICSRKCIRQISQYPP